MSKSFSVRHNTTEPSPCVLVKGEKMLISIITFLLSFVHFLFIAIIIAYNIYYNCFSLSLLWLIIPLICGILNFIIGWRYSLDKKIPTALSLTTICLTLFATLPVAFWLYLIIGIWLKRLSII